MLLNTFWINVFRLFGEYVILYLLWLPITSIRKYYLVYYLHRMNFLSLKYPIISSDLQTWNNRARQWFMSWFIFVKNQFSQHFVKESLFSHMFRPLDNRQASFQSSLMNGHFIERWSIVSSLSLHRTHLPGSIQFIFIPLSHLNILFYNPIHIKIIYLMGLVSFNTIFHHYNFSLPVIVSIWLHNLI